jgi:hypothetical protein
MKTKLPGCIPAVLIAISGFASASEPPDPAVFELEPIVVTPDRAPLDEPSRLLRILVEQSAPCLGCDAVLARPPRPGVALLQYLLMPTAPPDVDEAARVALEVKLHDAPDLEYLRP